MIKKDPSPGDLPNPGIEPRSSARDLDSIPGQGTKILHAVWYRQKIKVKKFVH